MHRLLLIVLFSGACCGAGGVEELAWHRRTLRNPSPQGYTAVARLAAPDGGLRAALACEGEDAELRTQDGRWTVTVKGRRVADGPLPSGAPATLFAKRTRDRLMLGAAGRWLWGKDANQPKGLPAVRVGVSAGSQLASFRLLAQEQVRFADDFPDPEPAPGRWAPVRGRWALCSLSFATQSANPAELAAVFGAFQDAASVGRTRSTTIGVGVRLGGVPARVLQLATDSPAARNGMEVGDIVRAVHGVSVSSGDGATALLAGDEGEKATLTVESGGRTRDVELTRTVVAWGTIHRLVYLKPDRPGREALITAGEDYWSDYKFTSAVHTRGVGAFGLVFAYLGPDDYHLFRWLGADEAGGRRGEAAGPPPPASGLRPPASGRVQLIRVRAGQATVLAERPGGFRPNDFYALGVAINGDAPGEVRARGFVDGTPLVEARDDAIVPGKLGFWAEAPGAVGFDDVVVGEGDLRRDASEGTANVYQRYDAVMRTWADPAYSWQGDGLEEPAWHLADFPGDVTLTAPFRSGRAIALAIAATREDLASGYCLELAADGRSVCLKRAGAVVAQKPLEPQAAERIALSRTSCTLRASLDSRPLVAWQDPEPLPGCAVWVQGVPVTGVRLDCPNVFEDYFNSAPTEWHAMSGSWEVMNRWVCTPSWSFFGGRSDDLLAIWGKRRMDGACFLDAQIGVMMFSLRPAVGRYEDMRDVGLTLCGDGRNVASGYAAIIGAEHNTVTALYRNGQLVASTRETRALLPMDPSSGERGEIDSQHRGWNHAKLTREGRDVWLYLREEPVLHYEDPEPLPGGYAAIWTVDSGLLLAKARLAASRLGAPALFLRDSLPFADKALTNDCGDGQSRVAAADGAYEITNAAGGGPFAIALRPRLYSAYERPVISFAVKLSPETKIDFYFRCHGKLCRVVLSGPAEDSPPGVTTLGTFEGAGPLGRSPARGTRSRYPDGDWHTVNFDLLGALRGRYPDDKRLVVWQPELANRSDRGYLLAGFGGNRAGATYWLRDISWNGPPERSPERNP